LRGRADRLDNSLTFMRDVASRLEGTNPVASAQAALELAMARTGARAGVVQWLERRRLKTVASQGLWTLEQAVPPDVLPDRTIQQACEKATPVSIAEVDRPGGHDSDVAAPILDRSGAVIGIVALRGLPPDSLRHAIVHDVGLIARWCAQAGVAAQRSRSPRSATRQRRSAGPPRRRHSVPIEDAELMETQPMLETRTDLNPSPNEPATYLAPLALATLLDGLALIVLARFGCPRPAPSSRFTCSRSAASRSRPRRRAASGRS
jgi:hypothetical protein